MDIDQSKVFRALAQVKDPQTGQDLITANRVRDLQIEDGAVNFTLELPATSGDNKQQLTFACMGAVQAIYPDIEVNVHFVSNTAQSQQPTSILPQVKNIIAVASGKGGVGKSTISTNLALGLKELGAKVGLLDADLYGPSLPTMFGLQGKRPKVQDMYGKPKIIPLEAHGIPVMSIGFIIEPEQAVVLRGPRLGGLIKQFLGDTIWPELDFLIIDLPPGTGDIQLTLVQTVPVTGAVLVTTPQEVAIADAIKAMNMFLLPSVKVPILGVVENMSWFTPTELPDNKYHIFGQGGGKKLAKLSESMLLGQVPLIQSVREAGDAGSPIILGEENLARNYFLKVAQNVARQTAIRNELLDPTQIVKMQN
ncbi:MAG: Mrp/NBP35 family ATP-binding protein [Bacteroidota bacterium]